MVTTSQNMPETIDIPGYGEVLDPVQIRLPPYTEDLGGGITHEVHKDGTEIWRKNAKLHRDNDLPAVTKPDGHKAWYTDGQMHRDGDQPADVYPDGSQIWYCHGKLHRNGDKPSVVRADGVMLWKNQEKCHREGDLPAVVSKDEQVWYTNGKRHRTGGKPAHIDLQRGIGWWFMRGKECIVVKRRAFHKAGAGFVIIASPPKYARRLTRAELEAWSWHPNCT